MNNGNPVVLSTRHENEKSKNNGLYYKNCNLKTVDIHTYIVLKPA